MSHPSSPPVVTARRDPSLGARVVRCERLAYSEDAPPELDRPPHVRAASGIGRLGEGWVIAQDDASFLAVRADDGRVTAIPLPPGADGRRRFSEALEVEGVAVDPAGLPRAWAVTDVDDPEQPATLCELALTGPW